MKYPTFEDLEDRRFQLLSRMTNAEHKANQILIKLKEPVYIQCIVFPYICDFVGIDHNFILELDGSAHNNRDEYDSKRDRYLSNKGLHVYRLYNEEVTEQHIKSVISQCPRQNMTQLINNINQERGGDRGWV